VNQPDDSSANSSRLMNLSPRSNDWTTPGRARLKRNAGRSLHEARGVHQIFYQALPYEVAGRSEEAIYFLVATPLSTRRLPQ
jgi:hypothetical protein